MNGSFGKASALAVALKKNSSMLRRSMGSTLCAAPLTRARHRSWLLWLNNCVDFPKRWSSQISIILFCNNPIEHLQGEGFNKCEYPKMDGIWKTPLKSGYAYFRKPPRSLRPLRTRSWGDPCWSLMWPVCLRIFVVAPNSNYTPIQLCWEKTVPFYFDKPTSIVYLKFLCLVLSHSEFSSINPPLRKKQIPGCSFWKNHRKNPLFGDDIPIFQASYPPILVSGKQILPYKVILGYFPGLALGPWHIPWLLILCTSCSWNGPPKAHPKIIARDRSPESPWELWWEFAQTSSQIWSLPAILSSFKCVFVNNWCNNCWILMEVWR